MDHNGVRYSTPLNSFETTLVFHYNKAIQLCQHIPCIEKVSANLYAHISATDSCVFRIRFYFFLLIFVLYKVKAPGRCGGLVVNMHGYWLRVSRSNLMLDSA